MGSNATDRALMVKTDPLSDLYHCLHIVNGVACIHAQATRWLYRSQCATRLACIHTRAAAIQSLPWILAFTLSVMSLQPTPMRGRPSQLFLTARKASESPANTGDRRTAQTGNTNPNIAPRQTQGRLPPPGPRRVPARPLAEVRRARIVTHRLPTNARRQPREFEELVVRQHSLRRFAP